MLETEGVVIRAEEEDAYVETSRASSCGSCSSKQGCGTTSLSKLLGGKATFFKVLNPIGAAAGERVIIGLEEAALLKSSALAYLLPLVLIFAGAMIGSFLASAEMKDAYSALGAGVGLISGFVALKLVTARAGTQRQFQPVILRRVFSHKIVKLAEDRE